MSLNIKDPTAHPLAQILAKETGATMIQTVTEAVRAPLARVRRQRKPEATVAACSQSGIAALAGAIGRQLQGFPAWRRALRSLPNAV